jgi:hypothetical protein
MKTLLLILVLSFAAFGQNRLDSVQKIYVDNLGDSDSSALIREKLRARLTDSDRFQVVESAEQADAVMTGAAHVDKTQVGSIQTDSSGVNGKIGASYDGQGVIRLVSTSTKETIWIYEYKQAKIGRFIPIMKPRSASGDVAGKAVKQLLKDAAGGQKKKK